MKRWENLPLGCLLAFAPPAYCASRAAPADLTGEHAALLGALAALALLCGALCWRHVRLLRRCATLQAQCVAEQALRATAERALRDTHGTLTRLAGELRAAREAERRRIGRDIHDDLGQHLLALQLDIGTLRAHAHLPPWVRQQVGMIEQHVRLTIRSLRAVIDDLCPAALEQGLRQAIGRQLDELARVSGIRCRFEPLDSAASQASAPRVDTHGFAAAETALFRILQEALSNVLRHAGATEVVVSYGRGPEGLQLVVRDNGVGLPPDRTCRGHGLSGIADRIAAAGGQLTLESAPGAGTTVRIVLPAELPLPAESYQPEYCV